MSICSATAKGTYLCPHSAPVIAPSRVAVLCPKRCTSVSTFKGTYLCPELSTLVSAFALSNAISDSSAFALSNPISDSSAFALSHAISDSSACSRNDGLTNSFPIKYTNCDFNNDGPPADPGTDKKPYPDLCRHDKK